MDEEPINDNILIGSQNRASVIGLYVSYAAPIFLRITSGRDKLVPGVFSLGKWYLPIGTIAVAWVTFVVVLLCFPPAQAVAAQEMSTCPDFITQQEVRLLTAGSCRLCSCHYHGGVRVRVTYMGVVGA